MDTLLIYGLPLIQNKPTLSSKKSILYLGKLYWSCIFSNILVKGDLEKLSILLCEKTRRCWNIYDMGYLSNGSKMVVDAVAQRDLVRDVMFLSWGKLIAGVPFLIILHLLLSCIYLLPGNLVFMNTILLRMFVVSGSMAPLLGMY